MDMLPPGDVLIRLGSFATVFVAFAILEAAFPRRKRCISRWRRWLSNVGMSAFNQVFMRVALPLSAMAAATWAAHNDWGLLNRTALSPWIEVPLAVLILDLAIYLQHAAYHRVPLLWRFHRMHHADTEFDVTTGIRFHPASMLLSGLIKLALVVAIGPSLLAVLVFEVLLNATSLFNHSNLYLPPRVDAVLRSIVVTPDMHRVHHSSDTAEMSRNFGFSFPWWDRLLRTYRDQPAGGHTDMQIGLAHFRQDGQMRLDRMLTQPFRDS
jgi:sterol desaturase/sphingolipid hydroxylase (fatty acid hydroxylase superfamily)